MRVLLWSILVEVSAMFFFLSRWRLSFVLGLVFSFADSR